MEKVLENETLWDFEDLVNDDVGAWLYFSRLPPKEDETAAAKKKPAKGQEELKPMYARAWLDFTPLLRPGHRVTEQRILLQRAEPPEPVEGEPEKPEEEGEEPQDIFKESQSYIHI